MLSREAFRGVIIALQSDINIWYHLPPFSSPLINEDLPGQAALMFTFDNRFSSTGWAVSQSVLGCALTFASKAKFEIEAKISLRLETKK
jgi:hypothetical protein